jgi:thioredoxin reductase (NADPH)
VQYDCVVIGGGIAGLQAAIQLGRYSHRVLVIDNNEGRSLLCRSYKNILGWPDGISGKELRERGKFQAEQLGVTFLTDLVTNIEKVDKDGYNVTCQNHSSIQSKCILLATGIKEKVPNIKNITTCLGKSIYVCPDCDGFEIKNKRTVVIGSGNTGASLAITIRYFSDEITYINHEMKELSIALQNELKKSDIKVINKEASEIIQTDGHMKGVMFIDNSIFESEKGFIAFAGNVVQTDLLKNLGVERLESNHVVVDPRTKKTNIPNIWAAGDITIHSQLVTTAMADGAQAAIWIHKTLVSK